MKLNMAINSFLQDDKNSPALNFSLTSNLDCSLFLIRLDKLLLNRRERRERRE